MIFICVLLLNLKPGDLTILKDIKTMFDYSFNGLADDVS